MDKKWDLIVVGGGLTGVAAAVAGRRLGLTVLILEKFGALGGAAATCLINPFMPYSTTIDGKRFDLSRGLFTEICKLLDEVGGLKRTLIHEEYMKLALDRLVQREGIDVLFHVTLCGVKKSGDVLQSVTVASKAGNLTFEGRVFIDCTGDADLAVMSGCPHQLGRDDGLCQPMTLCFRLVNVDIRKYRENRKVINEKYAQFQAAGKIKNPREDVLIFDTLVDGMLHFNTTRIVRHNPVDPFDVTRAEMSAREQMFEIHAFLTENIPGFESAQIAYSGSEIGVRESRMIKGEYVLNEMDLRDCTKFEDRIAAGNYDIDIHNPEGSGTSHYYFPEGTWYTIPYRSLIPLGVDNMLVAGRCISATHEAQASIRIMPIVTTLGEAAGVAAAVAIRQGASAMKQADISSIQQILTDHGAFIG